MEPIQRISRIKTIGLEVNPDKDPTGAVAQDIEGLLRQYFPGAGIRKVLWNERPSKDLARIDLYVILGGDGSFLAAARRVHGFDIPMIGVNIGTLGFLTAVEYSDADEAFRLIKEGRYSIEKRHMLKTRFQSDGNMEEFVALNDVVVTKGSMGRMLTYEVYIDGHRATTFRGDGIVFASPTGTTAYNLSAGGPIVYPTVDAISMTAICPHSLGVRNLVIAGSAHIVVSVTGDVANYTLSVDGQQNYNVDMNRTIEILDSGHPASIIRLDGYDYFDVLNKKIVNKAHVL